MDLLLLGAGMGIVGGLLPSPLHLISLTQVALHGAVFKVGTDGTGFTNLHSFNGPSDGASPSAGLLLSGNILFGTTADGGGTGGTVFKLNTDGTGFTTLPNFSGGSPQAALVLSGHTLYGTTADGGSSGVGSVFAINTDGTGFSELYSFTGLTDGANPIGALNLSNNTVYGPTLNGGEAGEGTVFSISFRPQLTITRDGTNAILSWPTNHAGFDYTGYTLQSTTNLVSPVWTTDLPAPVVVNEQNTVTNPISGTQQFWRLSQ